MVVTTIKAKNLQKLFFCCFCFFQVLLFQGQNLSLRCHRTLGSVDAGIGVQCRVLWVGGSRGGYGCWGRQGRGRGDGVGTGVASGGETEPTEGVQWWVHQSIYHHQGGCGVDGRGCYLQGKGGCRILCQWYLLPITTSGNFSTSTKLNPKIKLISLSPLPCHRHFIIASM